MDVDGWPAKSGRDDGARLRAIVLMCSLKVSCSIARKARTAGLVRRLGGIQGKIVLTVG